MTDESGAKPFQVMFLGGSNTRMNKGYVPVLIDHLSRKFGAAVEYNNYAVGISSCIMGLEQFLAYGQNDDPDIVFLEYAINDVSITLQGDLSLWRRSYEGLIRMVRQTYPHAAIYGLFFASRIPSHQPKSRFLIDGMIEWGKHYPFFTAINLHDELDALYTGEIPYLDDMHYDEVALENMAQIIVSHVETPDSAEGASDDAMPSSLFSNPMEAATLVGPESFGKVEHRNYSNSILNFDSAVLRTGQSITLRLTGDIVSVSFVSRKGSGILEVADRSGSVFIPTLHKEVQRLGSTLFMNAPFLWKDWSLPSGGEQTVRLTVHDVKHEPYRPFFSMIEPVTAPSEVQIRGLLVAR